MGDVKPLARSKYRRRRRGTPPRRDADCGSRWRFLRLRACAPPRILGGVELWRIDDRLTGKLYRNGCIRCYQLIKFIASLVLSYAYPISSGILSLKQKLQSATRRVYGHFELFRFQFVSFRDRALNHHINHNDRMQTSNAFPKKMFPGNPRDAARTHKTAHYDKANRRLGAHRISAVTEHRLTLRQAGGASETDPGCCPVIK